MSKIHDVTSPAFDWRSELKTALKLPANATKIQKADRGRLFERILHAMFEESNLQPRLGYRPDGEEIDGSIWLDGRTILVEAKWTQSAHPASSLYGFSGKVDGKLIGTLGVFVSMGGFSDGAADALTRGKALNVLLMDERDVKLILQGHFTAREALLFKLRMAGDFGSPYVPLSASNISNKKASPTQTKPAPSAHQTFVVEGATDAHYLQVIKNILNPHEPISFYPASGAYNLVPLSRALIANLTGPTAMTVVVDGDMGEVFIEKMTSELKEMGAHPSPYLTSIELLIMNPDIERALGLARPDATKSELRHVKLLWNAKDQTASGWMSKLEGLEERAAGDPYLKRLLEILRAPSTPEGIPYVPSAPDARNSG